MGLWGGEKEREQCVFQHASLSSFSNPKKNFHQARGYRNQVFQESSEENGQGPGNESHFKLSVPFVKP